MESSSTRYVSFVAALPSVMLTFTSSLLYKGQEGMSGFPMEDTIYKRAGDLGGRVFHHSNDERRVVYPQLMFNCTGTVNEVTVLGYINSPTEIRLELGLWRPQSPPGQELPAKNNRGGSAFHPTLTDDARDLLCRHELQRFPVSQPPILNRPGFHAVTFSTLANEEVGVVPKTILRLQQLNGILLYQRAPNGWPSYRQSDIKSICMPTEGDNVEEGSYDFPLISVDMGK